ncbi:hypothetical protein ACSFBF_07005 [Variovorax sp. ZT5P49]|uniref:hypothetical protein n=1 Tax=Variovorax sp. ZT5P49 TaxID=3443733 RepID=UPI003F47F46F
MRSPPPLPDDVIDRLFSALVLRYGTPFLDRWRDLNLSAVKTDWAIELMGFAGNLAAIRYGLDHLPEKPPTVMDFKRLCHSMPAAVQAIRYDGNVRGPTAQEVDAMQALSADIRAGMLFARPSRDWARSVIDRHANGSHPATLTALVMARDALGEPTFTAEEAQP